MKKIILILMVLMFSFAFSRDLNEIKKSGYLIIGIRNIPTGGIYQPKIKDKQGFTFELAESFAEYLNVKLKLYVVKSFKEYWTKDGEIMFKKNIIGTPDIYKKVDIIADIITVTESRKKLVKMTPFVENVSMFFTRKNEDINNYQDFKGKKIITMEVFNFYNTIRKELKKRDINYIVNKVSIKNNKFTYLGRTKKVNKNDVEIDIIPTGDYIDRMGFYYQVILGNADVSISDSFSFFPKLLTSLTFKDNLKALFPAENKVGYLAFCSSYNTPELNKMLSMFMEEFRKTERYNLLFEKYTGISYTEYKKIFTDGN
ncbi:transporter substrate-binding domain-containing protein [Haliovirga abyssi]|uniref:Solute-binding protein family 3/N-terminal domain-containing protein n=1 Tax=Haliovirga abyssi TaxID=2996794 RepID=A0AAU9DJL2_9FUSO|nr:transporter substrate-binding domain-containing protein [Haliovirga abyssi]BDU51044.1 hypothetical protein HLVA_16130 [Haliovirga abyssi]